MEIKEMETRPLIEARGLVKRYKGFVLDGVGLAVEAGSIVGLIGQNGSGKSTTIKALLGLIGIDAGEVRVLGCSSGDLSGAAAAMKEQIGVVFDTVSLPGHLKIREVARMMACVHSAWDPRAFDRYLATFKLDEGKAVKDLSRGMGMKLSLACALAHGPRVLILDEATAGLDPMAREEVLDMLRAFVEVEDECGNPRNAVLMSSHITSDLEKVADRVVCIDAGRVVFDLAKEDITDTMGIARCRMEDLDAVLGLDAAEMRGLRLLRHRYGVDVLVSNRFEFARLCPQVACDRVSIDDYMAFALRGELPVDFEVDRMGTAHSDASVRGGAAR